MEEIVKLVDLAFTNGPVDESVIEPGFDKYLYTLIRLRVAELRRDHCDEVINLLKRFRSEIETLENKAG